MGMDLARKTTKFINSNDEDDPRSALSSQENISFMWELTEEIWSLTNHYHAEQRLQRKVSN